MRGNRETLPRYSCRHRKDKPSEDPQVHTNWHSTKIKFKVGDLQSVQQVDTSERTLWTSQLTKYWGGWELSQGKQYSNLLANKNSRLCLLCSFLFFFFLNPKNFHHLLPKRMITLRISGVRKLYVTWSQIHQHDLLGWELRVGAQPKNQRLKQQRNSGKVVSEDSCSGGRGGAVTQNMNMRRGE
jgi:hypothetical protein